MKAQVDILAGLGLQNAPAKAGQDFDDCSSQGGVGGGVGFRHLPGVCSSGSCAVVGYLEGQ
jgi:hypothetical protein